MKQKQIRSKYLGKTLAGWTVQRVEKLQSGARRCVLSHPDGDNYKIMIANLNAIGKVANGVYTMDHLIALKTHHQRQARFQNTLYKNINFIP